MDGEDSQFILNSTKSICSQFPPNAMMSDDVDEKIHMRFASFTIYGFLEAKGVSFTLVCWCLSTQKFLNSLEYDIWHICWNDFEFVMLILWFICLVPEVGCWILYKL